MSGKYTLTITLDFNGDELDVNMQNDVDSDHMTPRELATALFFKTTMTELLRVAANQSVDYGAIVDRAVKAEQGQEL